MNHLLVKLVVKKTGRIQIWFWSIVWLINFMVKIQIVVTWELIISWLVFIINNYIELVFMVTVILNAVFFLFDIVKFKQLCYFIQTEWQIYISFIWQTNAILNKENGCSFKAIKIFTDETWDIELIVLILQNQTYHTAIHGG